MSTLERAIEIARKAHKGQVDKAGAPYIGHPLRVMERVPEEAKMAAVLHDVLEDSSFTLGDLRAEGFPESVVEAVEALTKRPGETYALFILRAASNDIARTVKLADLFDNCDLSRIPDPGPEDYERLKKYQGAIRAIRILFLDPPSPKINTPDFPERSDIIAEAVFNCVLCGKEAGHLSMVRAPDGCSLHRQSFTGKLTIPSFHDVTSFMKILNALRTRDIRTLHQTDFELTPFYCPECDACYCGDHFLRWDVFEEDMPMFHDCIMGCCPEGHRRMLED